MTELKNKILNKSFYQFLNRGFRACSLKDLEEATGLTKGAFYYYFKSKEEILKKGLERYGTVIGDISEEEFCAIDSLTGYIDVVMMEKERCTSELQKLFNAFIFEEFYFQLVLEVESLFPKYRQKIDELFQNRLSRWERIILKAKQNGEINEHLDTSVLARNLMSISASMLNIELASTDLKYVFSDMRLQFEQYYVLIKR